MTNIKLYPGSMGVAEQALSLFGKRVNVGSWPGPVYISYLSDEEVVFAKEFFGELGITVEEVEERAMPN